MLYKKVSAYLKEQNMLQKGASVLAAVSGGADSMCMLHLLRRLSSEWGFTLCAATFDHGIRPEGASDAEFVAKWCEKQGILCKKGVGTVPEYAKAHGLGLEESARILRYGFLRECAVLLGCCRIATAHNANDNAETVLLHLVRGTGLNGLSGIRPVQGEVIRPLLCCEREEIEAYLTEHHIPHVEDATNADLYYSRNYLRHEVLPLLRRKNPSLLEGLLRSGEALRQDEAYLQSQVEKIIESAETTRERAVFSAKEYRALPEALFNRAVQRLVEALSPETVLSGRNREAIRSLCCSQKPSALCQLPDGLCARREYDRVVLEKVGCDRAQEAVTLNVGETVMFGGRRLRCQWAVCPEGRFNQPWEYYLTAQKQPLVVRHRRTGDEITLPSRQRKTVKKLLIDSKVPRALRDGIAVLEASGKVVAVDGFGADQAFLPRPKETCWKISSEITE